MELFRPKTQRVIRRMFFSGMGLGFFLGAVSGWALTRMAYEVPAHVEYELTGRCPTCER